MTSQSRQTEITKFLDSRLAFRISELRSQLCEMVEQGALTDVEANEWMNRKSDEWSRDH